MVTDKTLEAPKEAAPEDPPNVQIPESFWQTLTDQPRCKVDGVCDGCGRCEH